MSVNPYNWQSHNPTIQVPRDGVGKRIPALLTYGLQELWSLAGEATADDVTTVYKTFQQHYREYLRDLLSALTDPRLLDAPRRIWERIQEEPGRIGRSQLKAALGPASGALELSLDDALYLLEVTGAVRLLGSSDNPIDAHPIASLLNLSRVPEPESDVRVQFTSTGFETSASTTEDNHGDDKSPAGR